MKPKYQRFPYYCAFERGPDGHESETLAVIWRYGGSKNRHNQPATVVRIFANQNEARVRATVEGWFPGIEYREYPKIIEGELGPIVVERNFDSSVMLWSEYERQANHLPPAQRIQFFDKILAISEAESFSEAFNYA